MLFETSDNLFINFKSVELNYEFSGLCFSGSQVTCTYLLEDFVNYLLITKCHYEYQ